MHESKYSKEEFKELIKNISKIYQIPEEYLKYITVGDFFKLLDIDSQERKISIADKPEKEGMDCPVLYQGKFIDLKDEKILNKKITDIIYNQIFVE